MSLHCEGPRSDRRGRWAGIAVVAAVMWGTLAVPASAAEVTAVIGDRVWHDGSLNGVQDAGEAGIPGMTVTLDGTDIDGLPVSLTTTTDAVGRYRFDVPAGVYTVGFPAPDGWLRSPVGRGNQATDSAGESQQVVMTVGLVNNTVDSGFYRPATVGDRIWEDLDGNGQDDGEPGLAGVTVSLSGTDLLGRPVDESTTTAADGSYLFTVLPGDYLVEIVAPADHQQTAGPVGPVRLFLLSGAADLSIDAGFRADVVLPTTPTAPSTTSSSEPTTSSSDPTSTSEPTTTQPTTTQPSTTQPTTTQSTSSQPTTQSTAPQPTAPQSTSSQSTTIAVSSSASGSATSAAPTVSTTQPAEPTTVAVASTTASVDPTAVTTAVAEDRWSARTVPSSEAAGAGRLAATGASPAVVTAGVVGAAVLALGSVLVLFGRRRPRSR